MTERRMDRLTFLNSTLGIMSPCPRKDVKPSKQELSFTNAETCLQETMMDRQMVMLKYGINLDRSEPSLLKTITTLSSTRQWRFLSLKQIRSQIFHLSSWIFMTMTILEMMISLEDQLSRFQIANIAMTIQFHNQNGTLLE